MSDKKISILAILVSFGAFAGAVFLDDQVQEVGHKSTEQNSCQPKSLNDECNGVDDDCDGVIDEASSALTGRRYYQDNDRDGSGQINTILACKPVAPYTALRGGDCNDNNPSIYPGAYDEPGNGVDENCTLADTPVGCVPQCTGKVCGGNGCGGSCGSCQKDHMCSDDGNACTPLFERGLCVNGVDDDRDGKTDLDDRDCTADN